MLRRQVGRVRYQPGDRLWLTALSRMVPRRPPAGRSAAMATIWFRGDPAELSRLR
jgi:hypothetical protein